MAKSKIGCVKQVVDEDSNFDFFTRLPTQMIQKKILIFKCYQVNNEKIKVLLMVKKTWNHVSYYQFFWPMKS
jgi:hypothetical protein